MQLAEAVNTCSRISLSSDRLGSEHVVLTTEKTWRGQGMHTQRTKPSCGRGCQGGLTIALLGWSALMPCAVVGGGDNGIHIKMVYNSYRPFRQPERLTYSNRARPSKRRFQVR